MSVINPGNPAAGKQITFFTTQEKHQSKPKFHWKQSNYSSSGDLKVEGRYVIGIELKIQMVEPKTPGHQFEYTYLARIDCGRGVTL